MLKLHKLTKLIKNLLWFGQNVGPEPCITFVDAWFRTNILTEPKKFFEQFSEFVKFEY